VNFTPQPLNPQERSPLPIEQEAGWAPELVWMIWRVENILSLPGFKPQIIRSVASQYANHTILAPIRSDYTWYITFHFFKAGDLILSEIMVMLPHHICHTQFFLINKIKCMRNITYIFLATKG
jgi:hypothetical protein